MDESALTNNFKTKKDGSFAYAKESSLQLNKEVTAGNTTNTTFDRIYRYYHTNKARVELSDYEKQIRERWEKAWFLLCRHRTRKQVADLLEKLFSIEKSTAYDDVRFAMMLFTNPKEDTKEAKRAIAETWAVNGANKCWKDGDMDGYYKFMKEYKDINQLNVPDDDGTLEKLLKESQATQIILVSSMDELKKQSENLRDGIVDVEHEDLSE